MFHLNTSSCSKKKKAGFFKKSLKRITSFFRNGDWITPAFIVFCVIYAPLSIYLVIKRKEAFDDVIGTIETIIAPVTAALSLVTWLKVKSFSSYIRKKSESITKTGRNCIALCISINNTAVPPVSPVEAIRNSPEIQSNGLKDLLDGESTAHCAEYEKIPSKKFKIVYQHLDDDSEKGRYIFVKAGMLPLEDREERFQYAVEFE